MTELDASGLHRFFPLCYAHEQELRGFSTGLGIHSVMHMLVEVRVDLPLFPWQLTT